MWERECFDAIDDDPTPIDERYYGYYSDVVERMGVEWLERTIIEYEEGAGDETGNA